VVAGAGDCLAPAGGGGGGTGEGVAFWDEGGGGGGGVVGVAGCLGAAGAAAGGGGGGGVGREGAAAGGGGGAAGAFGAAAGGGGGGGGAGTLGAAAGGGGGGVGRGGAAAGGGGGGVGRGGGAAAGGGGGGAAGRGGAAAGGGGGAAGAGAFGAAAGGAPLGPSFRAPGGVSSLACATTSGAVCACDAEVASCVAVKAVVASSRMRRFVMMFPGIGLTATNSLHWHVSWSIERLIIRPDCGSLQMAERIYFIGAMGCIQPYSLRVQAPVSSGIPAGGGVWGRGAVRPARR
jgi:hypothetical protein